MSDFDPVPNYQLSQSSLFGPQSPARALPGGGAGSPSLSLSLSPSLSLDPRLGLGGGASPALTAALGHYAEPAAPNPFSLAVPQRPPLAITGSDFLSRQAGGFLNPWLADPMKVAGDAQREMDMMPKTDPGLAKKQTILHSPTFRF